MTLKRMLMTVLMMLITVSAMSAEQKIWLHISGNGKAQVSLDGKTLELDKDNMATVKDAAGLKVAVSVKPDDGYMVTSVTAQLTTDAGNAESRGADDASFLEVTKASDSDTYTFTMPKDFNVSIYVTISKKEDGRKNPPPFTITTDNTSPNYYLLQNAGTTSFYAMPYTNDDEAYISTTNVPNSDMRFYFMDAGTDGGIQYYYIIHCSGKYLYAMGNANTDGGARLKDSATTPTDNRYKFSISKCNNASVGEGYFIINKQTGTSAPLCKRGGNVGIGPDGSNAEKNFLKMNTYTPQDAYFLWDFIPTPLSWTAPFTLSAEDDYHFYKIKNTVNTSFFISRNTSTNKVNTSSTASDDMTWIFEEVPTGENGSDEYITYYYIINALTGKYMCFDGDPSKYAQNQDNAVSVQTKTEDNEQNCQFIVTRSSQRNVTTYYNIIPKALKGYIWNNQSIGQKDKNNGTNVRTATDRSGETNSARWTFETTTFDVAWSDPVVTCDLEGNITITNEEDNAAFYYTIDGSTTPTKENYKYDASNKPKVNTGITTIKVRAIGGPRQPSNVVTKTIVYNPTIALSQESYTYTGLEQTPISSVDVNETHIDASEYIVTFKKNDAAADFKEAGDYTIELTDADGGNYIVYGSKALSIGKVELTVTVDNQDVVYGSAVPTYTTNCSGFVNDETVDNLTTVPTATCTYTATSDVGTYDIVPSGGEATNYSFNYVNGTLTVGQLEAVLAWSNTTLAYDGNPKAPTVTVSNLVEGDVCTVTLTIDGENATVTEGVKTAVEVGSYTATATALSNPNYKLPTDEAVLKCDFTIASSIVFSISIDGWTYGGSPNAPVATGNDDRKVTYAYKVKDAADVTYSETVPTKAGNYTVKGTIAAEGEYAESVATADFTIAAKSLSTGTDPNFTPADGITIDIDRDDEGYTITLKDGETVLVEGTEYDYSKSIDDTDSNFGKVTVTGANNYTGSFTSTYAKVAFTKPEEAGGGFAEAGLFDIPESSSIGDTATPAGLEAYIVVGINDDRTVEIEKLDYIPEGVPVLLLSNNEVSNGFTIMPRNGGTEITPDQKTSNKLKKASGTDEERHVDFATIYLLYRGEFVLNIAGTLPEGKIYLDAGGPSSGTRSSRLPIARGYSTGIKGVEDNEKTEIQDGRWYSLDGRRFTEKPTKKGIYLREGKKVVIK